jgi:hypothetical protein
MLSQVFNNLIRPFLQFGRKVILPLTNKPNWSNI